MRVSDDQGYAFDGGQFLGGALGVAAGDQDAGSRMVAMNFSDGLAHFVVGGGGHGAGVEHDQSRVGSGCG